MVEDRDANQERTRLVKTWCRWYDVEDPDDRWAEQDVIDSVTMGLDTVEYGWSLTLELLEAVPNDRVLGIIGASPVEDLLSRDPQLVAELIEAEAPRNERLRMALSHTWRMPSVPEDLFLRVKRHAQGDLDVQGTDTTSGPGDMGGSPR